MSTFYSIGEMMMKVAPVLQKTSRLLLRSLEEKDAENLASEANDSTVSAMTVLPYPYTIEHARAFIADSQKEVEQRTGFPFAIELQETQRIIGMMSLHDVGKDGNQAEVGYWVGSGYRNLGIASEALSLLLSFAFNELKLERVSATAYEQNGASRRLLQKHGFSEEGYRQHRNFRNGRWHTVWYYGLWHPNRFQYTP